MKSSQDFHILHQVKIPLEIHIDKLSLHIQPKKKRLQKKLLGFLKKLGTIQEIPPEVSTSFQRYNIDKTKVAEYIFKQRKEILKNYYIHDKLKVYMGEAQLNEALDTNYTITQYFNFTVHPNTFMDLPVYVVPWMDGVLVVPQD